MKLADTFKQFGVRSAATHAVYRALQRAIVFDVSHLMFVDIQEMPPANETLAIIRALTIQEVKRFAVDPAITLNESDADRLMDNLDFCIGAISNERLIGYCWLGLDSIEAFHNRSEKPASGVAISYPESTVFAYNAFILPDFIDSGVFVQLVRGACHFAHEVLGVRYLASTVECINLRTLQSCSRQGIPSLGRIWRFGAGDVVFTTTPALAKKHGFRLGKTAQVRVRGAG